MKRLIDYHLTTWKKSARRKPLLLKGARQIGKTYAVRQLGKTFDNFVEINFELVPEAKTFFEKDLEPKRILWELELFTQAKITPGTTLLFFDEIQAEPKALLALRYFYEKMPELHVIAAGSLIDFSLEKVGIPVGRVSMLYVYPLSFLEFLAATNNAPLIEPILDEKELSPALHKQLLDFLGHYLAIGGMPEAVYAWVDTKDPRASYEVQKELIETYRQDFPKYAKKHQLRYIETLFQQLPNFIGKQFKYAEIDGEYQKRELAPCLELLQRANIVHTVTHSAGNGTPLGAEIKLSRVKMLLLDVGISQAILGLDLPAWFLNPDRELVNRGAIVEAFVGQELLCYASPKWKTELYFWKRESRGALAEIDYLCDSENRVLPIEVKSGHGSTLRSMHQFLEKHPKSPFGIRFWSEGFERHKKIVSKPLYAVASLANDDQKPALRSLL